MPTLLVSGTTATVKNKLLTASAIIKFKKAVGFELFEPDEEWRYVSEDDDRVCPICFGFDMSEFFPGDDVPAQFPVWERRPSEGLAVVHPHVHWDPTYSYLLGDCRCRVYMLNISETLVNRLHLELQGAIET